MLSKNIVASTGKMVVVSKPLFFIVGSYFDELKKQLKKQSLIDESLREKNAQLMSALHEFKSQFIFHDDEFQEVIFPVDNLCWWSRKEVSSAIREQIMSKVGIAFSVPIPIRWYMFEIRLQKCNMA